MPAVFVTATGTDIGKTYVTAGLAQALRGEGLRVSIYKPVCSGFDPDNFAASDPAVLLRAMGETPSLAAIAAIAPWRFAAPLSPDMAAGREGRAIDFGAVQAFCEKAIAGAENTAAVGEVVLIEGIGGLMVPLTRAETIADLIAALAIPTLLVTGTYVGSLSHTLTALDVMRMRKIAPVGLIVNETPGSAASLDETIATLRHFAPDVPSFGLTRNDAAANRGPFALVADCLLLR